MTYNELIFHGISRALYMVSLDWKFPLAISLIYSVLCLLYNLFSSVPGDISINALIVYTLPYIGCSYALYILRRKKLYLDFKRDNSGYCANQFFEKVVNIFVPLTLLMQIISWIYIWNNVDSTNSAKEFFMVLRTSSIELSNIVPPTLTYPNGLCFACFCLALAKYRGNRRINSLILLSISILNIFLNDLQTSGRVGMAFVVFILLSNALWDWRVNSKNPFSFILSIISISIFTQFPKVLREGYQSFSELINLSQEVMRYCFSYLNTLTELLTRLPDPNWIGLRTFLPIYNLASKLNSSILRSAPHSIENSNVWGYNNYTISGELLRDFSYIGCILIPFFITLLIIYFASISSRSINISITCFFCGWLIYGSITNIFMMGGFLISIIFIFALSTIEKSIINSKSIKFLE